MPRSELVLTDSERRLALRRIVGFDRLASEEVAAIAERSRRHEFADGALVTAPDRTRASAHFLVSGAVATARDGRAWDWTPPQPLPDLFWLARDTAPLEVRARGSAVTLELAFDELEEIFADHFSLWLGVGGAVAGCLIELRRGTPSLDRVIRAPSHTRLSRFSERLGALREGLGFAVNAIEALAQLAESVSEVSFAPGTSIFREGDGPVAMIVPVEGVVRGMPAQSARALGGLEMLAGRPHRAALTAVTAVRGIRVEREDFLDVLEDHQDLARDMLAMLAMGLIEGVQDD
jgi:hypothetical protein